MINQVAFSTGISLGGGIVGFEFSVVFLFSGNKGLFISGKTNFVGYKVVLKYAEYAYLRSLSH